MANQGEHSVLLVDDELGVLKVLRLFLELAGYRVFEASNAEQAFEVIGREELSLAILDVSLRGPSGFDICKRLKSDPATRGIPVFMFTAMSDDDEVLEGERVGCDRYLTKPQNPQDIVNLADEYLRAG
jgi:DNA-binding response OmpR family regulator